LEDDVLHHLAKTTSTIEELIDLSKSESAIERDAALAAIRDANSQLRTQLIALEATKRIQGRERLI